MPILPAEASVYPETLFQNQRAGLADQCWRVLHTKPRQEKALARDLLGEQIPFFLPLLTKMIRVRGKAVATHLPLFPGYLFVLAGQGELSRSLATRRVVRSLDVANQVQLWDDLQQVQQMISSGFPIHPELSLVAGTPVEIRNGPLMGLRGVVIKAAAGERFVVKVNFIQRGASILIDGAMLEKISA